MSTKTETGAVSGLRSVRRTEWITGAISGFIGSVLFGLIMQYVMPAPLLEAVIPAMYGIEGPALATGWAFHQFHGVVLGLAYVALVQFEPLRSPAQQISGSIILGVGYAVVTTLLLAVLVMPRTAKMWWKASEFDITHSTVEVVSRQHEHVHS